MFKILLFIIAFEPILFVFYVALLQLAAGKVSQSLPSLAISIMCFSYLYKGVLETIDLLSKIKKDNNL